MEWFFDGIGTEIVSLLFGAFLGVTGERVFQKIKNKQHQNAGNNSVQIMPTGANPVHLDYVGGNKIVLKENDEYDVKNFATYNTSQIEAAILSGDDTTRRKWCRELIINGRQDYLIEQCISLMIDEVEKFRLLEELSSRGFANNKHYKKICDSLTNGVYITKAIGLSIKNDMPSIVESLVKQIENNRYIYAALTQIYDYDERLFTKIYDSGKCFTNDTYKVRMSNWVKEKQGEPFS